MCVQYSSACGGAGSTIVALASMLHKSVSA